MAMSKKNYIAAAEIIKAEVDAAVYLPTSGDGALLAARGIANGLANMFADDNHHFNRARFMDACGLGDPNGN